ncbi:hypothetical protein M4951_09285 [Blastopirellula sp. J2-11]|uniref:hypothetical protein n=1 Tax=Blastopirellula sp. J2-11 TaxID=2943192 RepID=UPI0021C79089|nr:hypothetical protein [Blastopirellula sp. J2-11]UUO08495.1 hypothetical protein M4951_09285 [Blastopirellula sp. J2-11]
MNLIRFSALVCLLAGVIGCGKSEPSPVDLNTEILNQLPEGDREIAINQWSCVVCKELLSKEGAPQKSEKTGTPVFFCTDECMAEFEMNPRKFQSSLSQ